MVVAVGSAVISVGDGLSVVEGVGAGEVVVDGASVVVVVVVVVVGTSLVLIHKFLIDPPIIS